MVDFLEESREAAEALRDVPPDRRGPLFGIPVSVKECHFVRVSRRSGSRPPSPRPSLTALDPVQGYDATAGLTRFMDRPLEKDSAIVQVRCPPSEVLLDDAPNLAVVRQAVRELGGVPFCLTNVPQTMKTYGCSNPVYGVTTHPLDPKRTPGKWPRGATPYLRAFRLVDAARFALQAGRPAARPASWPRGAPSWAWGPTSAAASAIPPTFAASPL